MVLQGKVIQIIMKTGEIYHRMPPSWRSKQNHSTSQFRSRSINFRKLMIYLSSRLEAWKTSDFSFNLKAERKRAWRSDIWKERWKLLLLHNRRNKFIFPSLFWFTTPSVNLVELPTLMTDVHCLKKTHTHFFSRRTSQKYTRNTVTKYLQAPDYSQVFT